MYHNFPAKEKILTSKRCVDIESNADSVKVTTADGSVYTGDIVIGADGVHSTVRKSM
jgi:2-polyprenyl-6-methoxyphenol hydroxylase-like FAD-dependent oxidoreductase